MSKCEKCKHKGICKHEADMQKFEKEIKEKQQLLENKFFHADIRCENFLDDKPVMQFAPGIR